MDDHLYNGPLAKMLRDVISANMSDPWSAEIDAEVRADSAAPLCINCLRQQEGYLWLCPYCGFPIGDYVPMMPYLQNFVLGELFRRGVTGPPERRIGVQVFLVISSLAEYSLFAPLYWYWMVRRARGKPICMEVKKDIGAEKTV